MIVFEKVARWYGQTVALVDADFRLAPGITGLVGPNGAGKSTLLKLMTGLLAPSRGKVTIDGKPLWNNSEAMRRIGYCPEHDGLYEELTAVEFVSAMTELHGFSGSEARSRAESLLDRVDLKAAMHRKLGEYSKGMRQRCKLAQALAHDPEVIVLDEPLTGCDPINRQRLQELFVELGRAGRTLILSSHVLHEIEHLTSRVVLIDRGRVVAEGDITKIRALIDQHPLEVCIECSDPRALAMQLCGQPCVVSVDISDDLLRVRSRAPDDLYTAIAEAARHCKTSIVSLTSADDDLAAVFRYLTSGASS